MLALLMRWLCSQLDEWTDLAPKKIFFFMNLFSSVLWAAQGGDGAELDEIKHSTQPNLTQQTGKKIIFFSRMGSLIRLTALVHEWVIELAQGRQWVRAAGNKNGGTNHVSDGPDLCQIKITTQPFPEKNTHRESMSKKQTLYKSCLKSSYTTRKHPSSWESHAHGSLAVEFTTCSRLLGRSMNWKM